MAAFAAEAAEEAPSASITAAPRLTTWKAGVIERCWEGEGVRGEGSTLTVPTVHTYCTAYCTGLTTYRVDNGAKALLVVKGHLTRRSRNSTLTLAQLNLGVAEVGHHRV